MQLSPPSSLALVHQIKLKFCTHWETSHGPVLQAPGDPSSFCFCEFTILGTSPILPSKKGGGRAVVTKEKGKAPGRLDRTPGPQRAVLTGAVLPGRSSCSGLQRQSGVLWAFLSFYPPSGPFWKPNHPGALPEKMTQERAPPSQPGWYLASACQGNREEVSNWLFCLLYVRPATSCMFVFCFLKNGDEKSLIGTTKHEE